MSLMNGSSNAAISGIPKNQLIQLHAADLTLDIDAWGNKNCGQRAINNVDGSIDITCNTINTVGSDGVDGGDIALKISFPFNKNEFIILRAENIISRLGMIDWWNRESSNEFKNGYIFWDAGCSGLGSSIRSGSAGSGFLFAKQVLIITPSYTRLTEGQTFTLQLGPNEISNPGIYGLTIYKGNVKHLVDALGIFRRKQVVV